ncbi:MAG: CRISPR system precrRNA processing endoribonuclease RAMP protein Cas6 [Anaerolineae bacterium]|nr:CRISPR system precrRNA processing endoribonuclease RAMP protein Cas6 [Anaerolineae bacterium]
MHRGNPPAHLMQGFTAMHFVFLCEALEYIELDSQPGTAIRGALYRALLDLFSPNEPIPGIPLDPVRALLAAEDEGNARGRDVPRAFAIEPPPAFTRVEMGRRFSFGVSMYGRADALMPYLFRAVPEMGRLGIGKGRGRFKLIRINEITPLNDSNRIIMHHQKAVAPRLTVTHGRVLEELGMRRTDEARLVFLTPMRLIDDGSLVRTPRLGVLLRRLIERAQALVEHYHHPAAELPGRSDWKDEWQRMGEWGDRVDASGLIADTTRWVDIQSFSRARGRSSPIGGFVGRAHWRIDSPEALAWLLWGQSLHVGKNAAKGDGYFRVE